ncbi:unnamed protein product [Effrenium voratum]|nr:unnamed protein product [Effrenium voratum]
MGRRRAVAFAFGRSRWGLWILLSLALLGRRGDSWVSPYGVAERSSPSFGAASARASAQSLAPEPKIIMRAGEKELDTDAVGKYVAAISVQVLAIASFFLALDTGSQAFNVQVPDWAVFGLFFGMSIRSRLFSPLDNSRPDINKASRGEATGGFNDRQMPSWTPPGIFFPIMWILIVAPLRAASSMMVWQQVGHLCDASILVLMLHLAIGDTWNTVNNVERRLGAAVPGVLCVWASALLASYAYWQVVPMAGQLLLPTCLWLTVAAALVADTWRLNNSDGSEPLFPYRGGSRTRFWFAEPHHYFGACCQGMLGL